MTSDVGFQAYLTSDQYLAKKKKKLRIVAFFTVMAFMILNNKIFSGGVDAIIILSFTDRGKLRLREIK